MSRISAASAVRMKSIMTEKLARPPVERSGVLLNAVYNVGRPQGKGETGCVGESRRCMMTHIALGRLFHTARLECFTGAPSSSRALAISFNSSPAGARYLSALLHYKMMS
jgi:hypothetical protein